MSVGHWLSENVIGSQQDVGSTQALADKYLSAADPFADRENAGFDREKALADILTPAAAGQGPSVANQTLARSMSDLNRQFGATTAGMSGPGSVLGRFGAQNALGNASGDALQTGVIARTVEMEQNRKLLSQLLQAMQTQSGGMYSTNLGAGLNAQGQANSIRAANSAASSAAFAAGLKAFTDAAGVFGSGSADAAAGSAGGGGGGDSGGLMGIGGEGQGATQYGEMAAVLV